MYTKSFVESVEHLGAWKSSFISILSEIPSRYSKTDDYKRINVTQECLRIRETLKSQCYFNVQFIKSRIIITILKEWLQLIDYILST